MSQNKLKIFCGNANPKLAQEICDYLGAPLGAATVESFPDGETFVRIDENIRGADVFIIQSTSNPANQHLMELFIMIDAARRAERDEVLQRRLARRRQDDSPWARRRRLGLCGAV